MEMGHTLVDGEPAFSFSINNGIPNDPKRGDALRQPLMCDKNRERGSSYRQRT